MNDKRRYMDNMEPLGDNIEYSAIACETLYVGWGGVAPPVCT